MGPAARKSCRHAGSSSWRAGSTRENKRRRQARYGLSGRHPSACQIGGDLNQIAVRIAAIYRADRTKRASPLGRAGIDRHTAVVQMAHHPVWRRGGDEAEIAGTGCVVRSSDPTSLIGAARPNVDLLAAELQRGAVVRAEILPLHA